MKHARLSSTLAALCFSALSFSSYAQNYSAGKEINVLQGFAAGGGSDALAQLVQPYLSEELGVNFINRYQPGATGAIAWTQLAKQTTPDGKTISITNTPMLMTNYIMNPSIKYNITELDPLFNVLTDPGILVVAKESPFNTIQEFIEHAKANPGKITVGNSGVGGDDFFSVIMIEKASGLKFQQVPFAGDGPSWTAAMGSKIDASSNNLGITYPQITAGNLKALAVYSKDRVPELPDVPTLKEVGIDVVNGSSRGYSGPKGMPEKAKQELIEAMKRVAQNPKFIEDAKKRAFVLDLKYGPDYQEFLEKQELEFKAIWDEIKDQVDQK